MGNRDNCDLHIPFKQWAVPNLQTLAREVGEDMKVIERWAQYFRKNCVGGAACEAAASAVNTGQEILTGIGQTIVRLIGTEIHACEMTTSQNTLNVITAGIYHITGHVNFSGFVGAGGAVPTIPTELMISCSPANDSLPDKVIGWKTAAGWIEGALEVSADIYLPAGATIALLFTNNTGGTATLETQCDAHLVHCDCEGLIFGGCA